MATSTIKQDDRVSKVRDMHGMHDTSEYQTWCNMLNRCYNPKVDRYPNYGGRGIKVCDRWKRLTILMRLDRNKWTVGQALGYEPPPARKPRHVTLIEYNGQKMSITEWAKERNLTPSAITTRLNTLGWSIPQALGFEPPFQRQGDPNSKAAQRQRRHRERLKAKIGG